MAATPVQGVRTRGRQVVQWLLAVVALLSFIAILAVELVRSYERETAFVTRNTQILSRLLEENLSSSVQKIDVAMQAARDLLQDHYNGEGQPAAAIDGRLARLLSTIPEAFSLRIVDAAGNYRFDASGELSPANIADRRYFSIHRRAADTGLFASEPLLSRVSGVWTITFSRRIEDKQGHFRGIVQASIKVDSLAAIYGTLPLGPNDVVSLWTTDMTLAARYPAQPAWIGKARQSGPMYEAARRGESSGVLDLVSPVDQQRRIYSFHRVGTLPYYVIVGRSWNDAFADWRRTALLFGVFSLLLSILTVRLILTWQRSYRQVVQLAEEMSVAYADSSQRSRALLDSIPDSAWLKDRDGNLIALNETYAIACGLSVAEVLSRNTRDLWPLEETRLFEEQEQEVIACGHMRRYEYPIHLHDGRLRYWETFRTPVYDEAGNLVGTAGIARDVTERRAADEERRLVAEVFGTSVEGIVITDAAGRILQVNRAFTELTGYSLNDAIGQSFDLLRSDRHDSAFFADFWWRLEHDGHWQGEIWHRRRNGEVFPTRTSVSTLRNAEGRMTHSIGVFTDISEQKAAEAKIRHLAEHDYLTDLPNRLLLNSNLEQAIAHSVSEKVAVALLFIDLDHFKDVNDSLGHDIGDRLLQVLAARLRACVSEGDTVSRQGGDEFVVLLMDCVTQRIAASVAERILSVAAQPILIDEHELNVTASIGISLCPTDGSDIHSLLRNADTALYQAKGAGRNTYQFFTSDMQAKVQERLSIENALRKAIRQEEFLLHYQPQFDTVSGRMVGVEALIRWQHPEQGMIPPLRFIGIAEESGLIRPIGTWVLQEACRQARRWQDAGMPALPVAVNVSAAQFHQGDLLQVVRAAVEAAGIAPSCLELEITESVLMNDAEQVVAVIAALKAYGVTVAIDDFGTGYSSLAYLKRFRTDKIKIDRSFVQDVPHDGDDVAIVRAIIDIARNLNQRVVAEGVETFEQLEFLRQQDCPVVQGYYFSKPLPAADVLANQQWWQAEQEA
jgi:diguanylate cyclase (GGDEF)-like protein/PAS domain S-box-containing protein